MNKKLIIGMSIVFLLILTIPKSVITLSGSSDNYDLRFSLSNLISNTSSSSFPQIRISANQIASNLTGNIQAGRLTILKNNLEPFTVDLNLPNNITYSKEDSINFSWSNTTDPNQIIDHDKVFYIIEIFNNSDLTQIYKRNTSIIETINTTETNITFEVAEQVFYWRILGTDGNLNSTTSEIRELIIDKTAPTNFNLTSPEDLTDTTDNTPLLQWTPSNETYFDNYTIEFSTTTNFTNPDFTESSQTNSFSNWTTKLDPNIYYWQVTAYDKAGNSNTSNIFLLIISEAVETIETVQGSTGPLTPSSGDPKSKPFNLDIIAPPSITLYANDSLIVPLIILNPEKKVDLRGIDLISSSDSGQLSTSLEITNIPLLKAKEQKSVNLRIINNGVKGIQGVTIKANVKSPKFSDSIKILTNIIQEDESTQTQSDTQIVFAKQLFKENFICTELNEYILQAEEALEKNEYDKALNLASNAIQSCKDLIAFKTERKKNTLEEFVTQKAKDNSTILIVTLESLAFLLVLIFVLKYITKKK